MGIVPNSRGKAFSLSPLNMFAVSYGFFIYGLYHSKHPSISSIKCFYRERVWDFVKFFYCINWDDFGFIFFALILWWYIMMINFCLLTHSLIRGINPTWSWYITLLKGLLLNQALVCSYFVQSYDVNIHKGICNFLVVSLPDFGISVKVFKIYLGCKFLFRSMNCSHFVDCFLTVFTVSFEAQSGFSYFFWPSCLGGILVPRPGTEPMPHQWKHKS